MAANEANSSGLMSGATPGGYCFSQNLSMASAPQQWLKVGPDVLEHLWLPLGIRVQSIVLHRLLVECDAVQQERHQRHILLLGQGLIYRRESLGVLRPVVGRNQDADQ